MLALLASTLAAPEALAQITNHESRITPFAPVVPGYKMQFPRDEGSHPDFRIEWWYVTGWLNERSAHPLGFQVTFFRARPELKRKNPSAFTPRQIMIAHAALSDPAHGRLLHDQRAARAGFGLAGSDTGRTRVWIDHWRLQQTGTSYHAQIQAREFSLNLTLDATQPPIRQGQEGYSRKGPTAGSASYYYSLPHLKAGGTVEREGKSSQVSGSAWLDHEWSSRYMDPEAVGWDWVGINLAGGAALMAFRMRNSRSSGSFWAGGMLRRADGSTRNFSPAEVRWTPRREWRSPRTGTNYPVAWTVTAGALELSVEPLLDDQEHDARASTGTIYWEGAVRASRGGQAAGLGYLELTGYWRRMIL